MTTKIHLIITCSILILIFILIFLSLYLTVSSRNPVTAVLFLITFFFEVGILFIFFGADYLGALFLMLYAGAISIIFLFVVMFLDLKDLLLEREESLKLIRRLLLVFFLIGVVDLFYKFKTALYLFIPRVLYTNWFEIFNQKTNIETIGLVFYDNYLFQFLVLGLLLFIIMVLIISLLINYNILSKKQKLPKQLKRKNTIKKF